MDAPCGTKLAVGEAYMITGGSEDVCENPQCRKSLNGLSYVVDYGHCYRGHFFSGVFCSFQCEKASRAGAICQETECPYHFWESQYYKWCVHYHNNNHTIGDCGHISGAYAEGELCGLQYGVVNSVECVFPDTQIAISSVGETKKAKDIVEGDSVLFYNFDTNKTEVGKIKSIYIHKNATSFVKYVFEDGTYVEATDYHPIYTKDGWKSLTNIKGYDTPKVGDEVKTKNGWKKITKIETWRGLEDCYDFEVYTESGIKVDNYFANGTLVQSSI